MSVRGWRIWQKNDGGTMEIVVEPPPRRDEVLVIVGNAVYTKDVTSFDDDRRLYKKISDGYGIMGILRITPEDSVLVVVTGVISVGKLKDDADILRVTGTEFIPLNTMAVTGNDVDTRLPSLQRLISSGSFYFSASPSFDLTLSAQRRAEGAGSDFRFFWLESLPSFSSGTSFYRSISLVSQMYVWISASENGIRRTQNGKGAKTKIFAAIVSRLSCERVGTRFNVRGANDLGAVANFVETEQLLVFEEEEVSFVQIRGSIPLFWDQPGLQVGSHKVKLRAFEASVPAYYRHFYQLRKLYEDVAVVTLLGSKEGERLLGDAFKTQHSKCAPDVPFIAFDYHAEMKSSRENIERLKKQMFPIAERHGYFHSKGGIVVRHQSGAMRTNCLDCLDRTNCVQTLLGLHMLCAQLAGLQIETTNANTFTRIEEVFKDVWQKNGDQCSVIYAGTGALEGKSKLKDASRSIARTIQNNLMDGSKQESFDLFLQGSAVPPVLFDRASNLLPTSLVQGNYYFREYPSAVENLLEQADTLTSPAPLTIFVGTWNVNGGKNMHNVAFRNEAKLSDWIFPHANLVSVSDMDENPDIVAIGVEELVDLNASNIVKASTTNQRLWCEGLRKTLHERAPYVLLGCEQLVGVCLFVFAKAALAPFLKDFSIASVKTGMGGATGNKGSVGLRLVVHSTSIVFVCSHFAAGQNEIRDRNEDYATAMKKLQFSGGRTIDSHDVIFWFGDFNYRISMGGEEVKRAVRSNQIDLIVGGDQLTVQKQAGMTFVGFEEGPLNFAPTYKYDTFSDDYDTSEKCRTPAWTDRVLWRETNWRGGMNKVQLRAYGRCELKTSDHRPVYALFTVDAQAVDWTKAEGVVEDVVGLMGPPDATVICSLVYPRDPMFPAALVDTVLDRVRELGVPVLATNRVDGDLWLFLESGESALAALSMDGISIGQGQELTVRLRTPDWMDTVGPKISAHDPSAITFAGASVDAMGGDGSSLFNFDEDDEEVASTMLRMAPPERPRPPSARSGGTPRMDGGSTPHRVPSGSSLANLDWPSDTSSSFGSISTQSPFEASWTSIPAPVPPPLTTLTALRASPSIPPSIPSRPAPPPPPRAAATVNPFMRQG
ncbi:unc-26 [Pristionchus pacificus]|nr:unc-26 [Pristionchus pacificus]|eukprot:PDM75415.1 unc-26 [Pristionchus pacificus]